MIASTIGGAMIGAGIGAIIGSERWERFQLPVRIAIVPQHHRLAVGVSVPLVSPRQR